MRRILMCTALALFGTAAQSDILIEFVEASPNDRFVIHNISPCDLVGFALEIDLSRSEGGLVFDTNEDDRVIEVFQSYQLVSSSHKVALRREPIDGARRLMFDVEELDHGASVSITVDIDDTTSEIGKIVSGEEMVGSIASAWIGPAKFSDGFDEFGNSQLRGLICQGDFT